MSIHLKLVVSTSRYMNNSISIWIQAISPKPRKKTFAFHYTGCLIGILVRVYEIIPLYNWVVHPLYTLNNLGPFFIAHLDSAVEICIFNKLNLQFQAPADHG